MKKNLILVAIVLSTVVGLKAQGTGDLMLGGAIDVLKSNNDGFGDQVQLGIEVNYFFNPEFSITAGFENWTSGTTSLVIGGRYYIQNKIFTRIRGLIGESDISVGGGYSYPINKHWRIEAMGDIYFKGDFALRGGVAYVLGKVY